LTWVFESDIGQNGGDDSATFVEWLRTDDDLYWISGRPGSGRSTLTKFLYTHDSTKEYLPRWAGENKVVITEYLSGMLGRTNYRSRKRVFSDLCSTNY
jgi:hypothetical protein